MNKREYAPGQHGQRRKGKMSDFGTQLRAKQKLKGYYGDLTEKQFRRIYDEAERQRGDTSELVSRVLAEPVEDAGFPFMACGAAEVCGVPGRLFRISFSGERAYEVAVPARFGAALFAVLVERARGLGGGAYGMEALNVLRIEKGLLTHAEIDGRKTADDLGLGRMLAAKDCIGKAGMARPGLSAPGRGRGPEMRLPLRPGVG